MTVWDECGNKSEKTYTKNKITFYKNLEDTTTEYDVKYVISGTSIGKFPTAPTDTTKSFVGWFKETTGETTVNPETVVTKDQLVYASWTTETVTVTFEVGGSNIEKTSPKGRLLTDVANEVTTPTKAGYKFVAWKVKSDNTVIDGKYATVDVTLVPSWELGNVDLILNPMGGTNGIYSKLSAVNGTEFSKVLSNYGSGNTTPTKKGYRFSGWKASDNGGTTLRALTDADLLGDNGGTVYAQWVRDEMKFETKAMTDGKYGGVYSDSVTATNGTGIFKYTIVSGALPDGLTLNENTGVITGTIKSTIGDYAFTVKAIEQATEFVPENDTGYMEKAFSIKVGEGTRPTVTDKTINIKSDATNIQEVIKSLYMNIVGVNKIEVGSRTVGEKVTYPVVVYYDTLVGGGSEEKTVICNEIAPNLVFAIPSIPSITSLHPNNASEETLLEYLNSYI